MFFRMMLGISIVVAGWGVTSRLGATTGVVAASANDGAVQSAAALRLGHHHAAAVIHWLDRQPQVRAAWIGRDGRTVEIAFRDGQQSLILSPLSGTIRVSPRAFRQLRPMVRPAAGFAPALVLEPFATELGLGPNAGDPEVSALSGAGFQVTQLYDGSVTVSTMTTLPSYDVVYMHTHSGIDTSGRGVLATGQQTNCGAYSNADGSVVAVGVAGSTQCFLAITSVYITGHMSRFSTNSLLFLNGCSLLNSTDFMGALLGQGAGVVLSWDADGTVQDDFLSGAAFFNQMAGGASVSAALQTLYANGYGTSAYQGQKATLGFRGNGAITLQSTMTGGPPAVTPTAVPSTATPTSTATAPPPPPTVPTNTPTPPTSTPVPNPTPTVAPPAATPTSTPTNTSTPPNPVVSLHSTVKSGASQSITVKQVDPQSNVHFVIRFPNTDSQTGNAAADAGGEARFSFLQRASKITRRDNTARVIITGKSNGSPFSVELEYRIGFGSVDVSVQPRRQVPGKYVSIWVHSVARVLVSAKVKLPSGVTRVITQKTGAHGWADIRYLLGPGMKAHQRVIVRVDVHHDGKDMHSSTSFVVS